MRSPGCVVPAATPWGHGVEFGGSFFVLGWAAAAWPQHCPQGVFGGVRVDERWWERLGSWVGMAVVAEHGAVVLCPAACPDYQISQWEIAGILMPEPVSGCAEAAPRVQEGGSTRGGPGRSPPGALCCFLCSCACGSAAPSSEGHIVLSFCDCLL